MDINKLIIHGLKRELGELHARLATAEAQLIVSANQTGQAEQKLNVAVELLTDKGLEKYRQMVGE